MQKFIKLTNEADLVPRLHLELLGVSTKRDNDDTIGQFGSGTKFAPIYALRNGWEWVNVGYDRRGGYIMKYVVIDKEGIDVVQFVYEDEYGNTTVKDSSYSMGAGELGWDHPFQIFREAFANALDAHYEFGASYDITLVDKIDPPEEGLFSVYLTATDPLLELIENFDKYFSLNREPVFEDENGNKIFEKLNYKEGVRIYHKGVLVYGPELGGSDAYSLFDYDLTDVRLNEERRLKDISVNEMYEIARMFSDNGRCEPGDFEWVISSILEREAYTSANIARGYWEWMYSYAWSGGFYEPDFHTPGFGEEFHEAATEYFLAKPEVVNRNRNRIAYLQEDVLNVDEIEMAFQEKGVHAVVVSAGMYNLLKSTGAADHMAIKVLGEEYDTPFVSLKGNDLKFFNFAMDMVVNYDIDILNYKVKIMAENKNNRHIDGKVLNLQSDDRDALICINQRLIDDRQMERVVSTLIHELDHCVTGAADGSRKFRDAADKRLGKLLMIHYCDKKELLQVVNDTAIENEEGCDE